jgi:hypothetical protein
MPSRTSRFAEAAREAREATNRELAGELSSLVRLTEEDIERLLPRKKDKKDFAALMAIVTSATDNNTKVATLKEKFEEVGAVTLKVLKTLL